MQPEKFGPEINSEYQEPSACLNAAGNVMYFSSNRPGGFGGKDLYRVIRFGNGDWSQPLNLGPTVNTPEDEDAPFFHANERTLYFSSRGHQNIGGYDIFKSEILDNGTWTTPENMKYPINTVDDDIYFVLSEDEQQGFYSTERQDGSGDKDLYQVYMPKEENLMAIVKGEVTNSTSNRLMGVACKITLIDDDAKTVHGVYHSQPQSGKYMMVLQPNVRYRIIVEADGHYTHTEDLEFTRQDCFDEVYKPIVLEARQ